VGGQATDTPTGTCMSGSDCKARNDEHLTDAPLCPACLDAAGRDTRNLIYDYLDLAQLHETSMSQAISEKTSGGEPESPMLLVAHIDELQAEIVHVTALWEHALRAVDRLHNPRTFAPLWRTKVYDHIDLSRGERQVKQARDGAIVQRAVGVIAPRLGRLAGLPKTVVCPAGVEDEPAEMAGWEAVHHLQRLHARSRAALGRTTRRFWIPGECWTCGARPLRGVDGPLYRSEPRDFEDPMQVFCSPCGATRPYADYEAYQAKLQWPGQESDTLVRIAA
jgi:hypothetical protein